MPRPHRDQHLPPRTPRILHLDVDAFLASVEQARHPHLRGRPVVVGGSPTSRNLVMSCSYEARAVGVRPGMRAREAARLCPRAVFLPGDAQAANAKREEVARLLLEVSPRVEVASIDDFFVDLTGTGRLLGCAFEVATALQRRIRTEARVPVTIGLGTSRTLARLAGKLGKPGGVAEVLPGAERAFLANLPVEHLPGVGHAVRAKLTSFHIKTVGQLALVSREVLFATFGSLGLTLHARARGEDDEPVQGTCWLDERGRLALRAPQSIRRDSTFEPEEGRREQLEAMLAWLVDRAAARLRGHGLLASSLEVRLVHVDTRTPAQKRAHPREALLRARRRLSAPTASTTALEQHALLLLRGLPRRRALVKRVGLTLLHLRDSAGHQGELFSDPQRDRSLAEARGGSHADRAVALERALDGLRARHGFGKVLRGASLPLLGEHPLERDGFVLRTPSLNQ
jgi:DNA polymerase-4